MSKRIIIEYEDSASECLAIDHVASVIRMGRISTDTLGRKHFCWATKFEDGTTVYTRGKRHEAAADSFWVTCDRAED